MRAFLSPFTAILAGCAIGFSVVNVVNAQTQTVPVIDYIPESLMVDVPNIGMSRIETVEMCLSVVDVERYHDMMTDWEFSEFEYCMEENT